jgi:hypothetical protein
MPDSSCGVTLKGTTKEDTMPLVAFLIITAVVLGISIVGMFTGESDPTFAGEGGYEVFDDSTLGKQAQAPPPRLARGA